MRFSVYKLIGKRISFEARGRTVKGVCEDVKRDVLNRKIIITVKRKGSHVFNEPHRIVKTDGGIAFIYGSEQSEDLLEFCGEDYAMRWGEDLRASIGRERNFLKTEIMVKE